MHQRLSPLRHGFSYDYFFLDIDLECLSSLSHRFFSHGAFNWMGFDAQDHFGSSDDLRYNARELCRHFGLDERLPMRFVTLPRIAGFVFNPISLLLLMHDERPKHLLAEVHNYNGGRVVYNVPLTCNASGLYQGEARKSMYVSPFFDYEGLYRFDLRYDETGMELTLLLERQEKPQLVAHFKGASLPFESRSTRALLCRHTFLSLFVVTRTLWQSLRLWRKKLPWHSPRPIDQLRRF